jgi:hypothetical protein
MLLINQITHTSSYTDLFLLVRASLYPVSAMQGLAAVLLYTIAAGAGAAAAHVPEFFSFYGHNASAQE